MFKLEEIVDSIETDANGMVHVVASPCKVYPAYFKALDLPITVRTRAAVRRLFVKDCIRKWHKVHVKLSKNLAFSMHRAAYVELADAGADLQPAAVAGYLEREIKESEALTGQIRRKLDGLRAREI